MNNVDLIMLIKLNVKDALLVTHRALMKLNVFRIARLKKMEKMENALVVI